MKYRGVELIEYHGNWYHPNFFIQGPACIKRAKYTCQHCKAPRGGWQITKDGRLDSTVIQACHVFRDDTHNPRAKLIALCKPCHLAYDAPMHGEKAGKTKRRNAREEERKTQQDIPLKLKKEKKKMPWNEQKPMLVDKRWENQTIEKLALVPRRIQEKAPIARQETLL